jgi:hypothetical protein
MVPIDDSGESIESIKLKLATTEQETKRAERTIGDADATARFAIAKIIVIAYVIIILLIFLVLACDALLNHRYDVFYTNAFELVKIAVIPIVTYVLGYYSARSTR